MKLHDYQQRARDQIVARDRLLVVSALGSGKTLLTLDALCEIGGKTWVFAPLRIAAGVWSDEAAKWGLPLRVSNVVGSPAQRRRALAVDADVYCTNFENVDWLFKEIGALPADTTVVIDESSRIKNPKGRRLKTLAKLISDTTRRIGLTGTPAPQGVVDLFAQVNTIIGPVWGRSFYTWRARYFRAVDRDGFIWKPLPGSEDEITASFAEHSYRVDYDLDVPFTPLVDYVDLPNMADYREMEKEAILQVKELGPVAAFNPLSQLMKCRQLASGVLYSDDRWVVTSDAKIRALRDIIEDSGERVLVAYQFRAELEQLGDVPVLGGGTSAAEGADIVRRWNAGEIPVLAGHPASFGHGLNMQGGGRRLVWLSLPWSLEEYEQANARLARQGQRDHVFIHHLISRGTVDEKVLRALQTKTGVQNAIIKELST